MAFSISDEQDYPRITPAVQWLIAINVAIFFLQLTVVSEADMRSALAFEMRNLTERPWTIVTYMFMHAGFWHLALNMYTLWLFGPRVEREWNAAAFARFYVWCGLGGWLFHLMLTGRNGGNAYLLGASAAVFGVMLAYAMRWPDEEILFFFFIPMKVKWLVVLLAGVNLAFGMASMGNGGSGVAYFAHLGGLAFGWLYLRWSQAPSIDRLRQRMSQIPDVPDEPPRAIPRSQPRPRERMSEVDEIVARSNALSSKRSSPGTTSLTSRFGKKKAEELNGVLDKISEHGIESLTRDERKLLEEMSKKLRGGEARD
ncbi:MAG TPA: rhomboid family intramembrane serine protease [Gemmatimonadaceae bacterium]|nr:rhomboid family intramembrane serine protease [Gemmatimonadaceae bacterium]